jgi:hypothetical protein
MVEYVPWSSTASGTVAVQPISMHVNTRTTSWIGSRRNSVKLRVIWVAPLGAIIHIQLEVLEYGDWPDPSDSVPLAAVRKPHEDPQPVQEKLCKDMEDVIESA